MRTSIGLAIAHGRIRVVLLRGRTIAWAGEDDVDDADQLSEAIARLLRAIPIRRWYRPRLTAALGPGFAQVRHLSGLPPLTDPVSLARIVQEGAGRFFLKRGWPLVTTGVRLVEPGTVWAAAFDEPVVRAVATGCRTARVRLQGIVPTVCVLGAALEGDEIVWPDGPVAVQVTLADGRIAMVRRFVNAEAIASGRVPLPREELQPIGDSAWRFADAYGAAVVPRTVDLLMRPGEHVTSASRVPRWRVALASTALLLGTVWALLAPGLAAARAGDEARAVLDSLSEGRNAALIAVASLQRITSVLEEVADFEASRQHSTLFLSALTEALPERSALLMLRFDTAGGTVVAVGPRAAQVVAPLERIAGITGLELVGPVTPEAVGSDRAERVTLRFQFAGSDSSNRASVARKDER
jgi:hypothetical protein